MPMPSPARPATRAATVNASIGVVSVAGGGSPRLLECLDLHFHRVELGGDGSGVHAHRLLGVHVARGGRRGRGVGLILPAALTTVNVGAGCSRSSWDWPAAGISTHATGGAAALLDDGERVLARIQLEGCRDPEVEELVVGEWPALPGDGAYALRVFRAPEGVLRRDHLGRDVPAGDELGLAPTTPSGSCTLIPVTAAPSQPCGTRTWMTA